MRKIDFRMFNPCTKKMMYNHASVWGCLDQQVAFNNNEQGRYRYNHTDEGFIFMQSVDFYDDKDVKIYEGDIVKQGNELFIVKYLISRCNYAQGFYLVDGQGNVGLWKDLVVVGNIYENPELLIENTNSKEENNVF